MKKLLLTMFAVIGLGWAVAQAHAQDRAHAVTLPPVELICLDTLDAVHALDVVRSVVNGTGVAHVEADRQTNCLVVIGLADATPVRRLLETLEARARTRARPPARARPSRPAPE